MSRPWTFESAVKVWRQGPGLSDATLADPGSAARTAQETERWARFQSAECFLLDHEATSPVEADLILEVLIDQRGDGRSDGRDLDALRNLKRFIGGRAQPPPRAAAGLCFL